MWVNIRVRLQGCEANNVRGRKQDKLFRENGGGLLHAFEQRGPVSIVELTTR